MTKTEKEVFKKAISLLENGYYGPRSLREYLKENFSPDDPIHRTQAPTLISIDAIEALPRYLQDRNIMILRLGSPKGQRGTNFILISVGDVRHDYFLIDEEVFDENRADVFTPTVGLSHLMPYFSIGKLSETGLVNLAFTSGLLSRSLGLDTHGWLPAPARTQAKMTFSFLPHSSLCQKSELHDGGQVDIDAVFIGKREGIDVLFVIEAKANKQYRSLAKHKLVYPSLGISESIPEGIPIVPVYMKIDEESKAYRYSILECELPDPRKELLGIDQLKPAGVGTSRILPKLRVGEGRSV